MILLSCVTYAINIKDKLVQAVNHYLFRLVCQFLYNKINVSYQINVSSACIVYYHQRYTRQLNHVFELGLYSVKIVRLRNYFFHRTSLVLGKGPVSFWGGQ